VDESTLQKGQQHALYHQRSEHQARASIDEALVVSIRLAATDLVHEVAESASCLRWSESLPMKLNARKDGAR